MKKTLLTVAALALVAHVVFLAFHTSTLVDSVEKHQKAKHQMMQLILEQ